MPTTVRPSRKSIIGKRFAKSIPVTKLKNGDLYVLARPGKLYDVEASRDRGTVFTHSITYPFHTTPGLRAFVVSQNPRGTYSVV